eukprot:3575985-Ditylum_brightwellii.AAC.1
MTLESRLLRFALRADSNVGNAVLLNHPTDGVSCETNWNFATMIEYFESRSNQLSFHDINHNVKNG